MLDKHPLAGRPPSSRQSLDHRILLRNRTALAHPVVFIDKFSHFLIHL